MRNLLKYKNNKKNIKINFKMCFKFRWNIKYLLTFDKYELNLVTDRAEVLRSGHTIHF